MLTEAYIEALLVDEELADWVWEAWDAGEIDEATAFLAWALVAYSDSIGPGMALSVITQPYRQNYSRLNGGSRHLAW